MLTAPRDAIMTLLMLPLEDLREPIANLCRLHRVRRLDVFGSAARSDFDPARSDVDLLVEFDASAESTYADAWFGLRDGLEALIGRPVDLLSATAIRNPYLRAELQRTRRALYAA